jgi:DNA-binding transcriptional ArsR family regulator
VSSQTPAFEPDLFALADVAKALGHPARLRILEILAAEACICGDIVGRLPLSQSTVSQHLAELKKVGLIRGEVSGPRVCYVLDSAAVDRAQRGFARLFDAIGRRPPEGERHEERG